MNFTLADHASPLPASACALVQVGVGFRSIEPGTVVQAGDEYCTFAGRFVQFSQELIGRALPSGYTARRVSGARA